MSIRLHFPNALFFHRFTFVAVLAFAGTAVACEDLPECNADGVPFKGAEAGVQFVQNFEPPILTVGFISHGRGTQVGAYKAIGSFEINVVTMQAGHARATLSAANGDQIGVELIGTQIDPFTTLIYGEIARGSGRFEGATGCYYYLLETKFPGDVLPNTFIGTWRGVISSVGAK